MNDPWKTQQSTEDNCGFGRLWCVCQWCAERQEVCVVGQEAIGGAGVSQLAILLTLHPAAAVTMAGIAACLNTLAPPGEARGLRWLPVELGQKHGAIVFPPSPRSSSLQKRSYCLPKTMATHAEQRRPAAGSLLQRMH